MKKYIVYYLLLVSTTGFAQTTENIGIDIGFSYSALGNYRTIGSSLIYSSINLDGIKYGNAYGLDIQFKINERSDFLTGLQYQERGFKIKRTYFENVFNDPAVPNYTEGIESYKYITLPFILIVNRDLNNVYLFGSIGINANFFFAHNSSTTEAFDENIETMTYTDKYGPYNFTLSPLIGFGLGIHLLKIVDLKISPYIQHDIIKIEKVNIERYLFDFGIKTSLAYKF